jgi:hypothetical protein
MEPSVSGLGDVKRSDGTLVDLRKGRDYLDTRCNDPISSDSRRPARVT